MQGGLAWETSYIRPVFVVMLVVFSRSSTQQGNFSFDRLCPFLLDLPKNMAIYTVVFCNKR